MVYRNFHKQLSPDAYFVNAMWHLLATASAHAAASGTFSRRLVFHIFSERPPRQSWTGHAKVPVDTRAEYVDELGCASSLEAQLRALAGMSARWELRLHLDLDTLQVTHGRPRASDAEPELLCSLHGTSSRESHRLPPPPPCSPWLLSSTRRAPLSSSQARSLPAEPVTPPALQTFAAMARADALIASDSSFSLAASVLSSGVVLSMRKWRRFSGVGGGGLRFPLPTEPDGSFDCADGVRQWAQAARARTGAQQTETSNAGST